MIVEPLLLHRASTDALMVIVRAHMPARTERDAWVLDLCGQELSLRNQPETAHDRIRRRRRTARAALVAPRT